MYCRRPVWFLARGDAFRNSRAAWWLRRLHCIPVYRLSEGKENLHLNEQAFEDCLAVLRRNGIILIFSEGICENEWKLRPLKKGTARLAFRAWEDPAIGAALRVLPVGITYHSFHLFNKHIFLNAGEMITRQEFSSVSPGGATMAAFTERIRQQMDRLILQFDGTPAAQKSLQLACLHLEQCGPLPETFFPPFKEEIERISREQGTPPARLPGTQKEHRLAAFAVLCLTAVPALAGWLLNEPCWRLLKGVALKTTTGTVYYDSVLFGLLVCGYPLYVLLLTSAVFWITGSAWSWLLLPAAPFAGRLLMTFRSRLRRYRLAAREKSAAAQKKTVKKTGTA